MMQKNKKHKKNVKLQLIHFHLFLSLIFLYLLFLYYLLDHFHIILPFIHYSSIL